MGYAERWVGHEEQTGMMRALAIGLIVLAGLVLAFTVFGVLGAFMVEEDSAQDLIVYGAMAAVGLLMLWGGLRLLRRQP